jgi:hypothetical protein
MSRPHAADKLCAAGNNGDTKFVFVSCLHLPDSISGQTKEAQNAPTVSQQRVRSVPLG